MSSESSRNPGRLSRNHFGKWTASSYALGSSCGYTAQKGLERHMGREAKKLSLSRESQPLFVGLARSHRCAVECIEESRNKKSLQNCFKKLQVYSPRP